MTLHASWTHGNALTVENPENVARNGRFGWGADILMVDGRGGWFHIPVPTPVIELEGRTKVQKLFMLFESAPGGTITSVHIWDGPTQIQQFNGLSLTGQHRGGLDAQNTFTLTAPHTVSWGMGISFFYQDTAINGSGIFGPPVQSRLIVSAAGGDFVAP